MSIGILKLSNISYSINMKANPFIDELTKDYLEWQYLRGIKSDVKDFAEYLDIHRVTMSRLMTGSLKPSKGMLFRIAQKTGNPRYYDFADAPRPDPLLSSINQSWENVPEDVQQKISDMIAPYVTGRHEQKNSQARSAENSA